MKKLGIIILAAGQGRRIGFPKALLTLENQTYLEIIISKLSKITCETEMISVINSFVEEILTMKKLEFPTVINSNTDDGMSSSIKLGIDNLPECDFFMIYPVDHPKVEFSTIQKLVDSCEDEESYYVPTYKNRKGHPIIISAKIIKQIHSKLDNPLNVLLKDFSCKTVCTDDAEILRNINYKEDIDKRIK